MLGTLIAVYFSPFLPIRALHEAHIETCLISGKLFVIPKTDTLKICRSEFDLIGETLNKII